MKDTGLGYSAIVAFIMWMDRGGIVDEEGGNFCREKLS